MTEMCIDITIASLSLTGSWQENIEHDATLAVVTPSVTALIQTEVSGIDSVVQVHVLLQCSNIVNVIIITKYASNYQ